MVAGDRGLLLIFPGVGKLSDRGKVGTLSNEPIARRFMAWSEPPTDQRSGQALRIWRLAPWSSSASLPRRGRKKPQGGQDSDSCVFSADERAGAISARVGRALQKRASRGRCWWGNEWTTPIWRALKHSNGLVSRSSGAAQKGGFGAFRRLKESPFRRVAGHF